MAAAHEFGTHGKGPGRMWPIWDVVLLDAPYMVYPFLFVEFKKKHVVCVLFLSVVCVCVCVTYRLDFQSSGPSWSLRQPEHPMEGRGH